MNRVIKLAVLSVVMIAASVFAAPKSADAGYGYGYGYGYRSYGYNNYYRPYYAPVYVAPVYNYGFCY
jgi:hypothetical protein